MTNSFQPDDAPVVDPRFEAFSYPAYRNFLGSAVFVGVLDPNVGGRGRLANI